MITHVIEYKKSTTNFKNYTLCGIQYDFNEVAKQGVSFAHDVCIYGESRITCDSCVFLIFETKAKYSNSYSGQCLCGKPCDYNSEKCNGKIVISGHKHYCEYHAHVFNVDHCLPVGYGI